MTISFTALLDQMESHAAASGHFERVGRHEPKNPPDGNLTAAMWIQGVTPFRSGLASTSVVLTFMLRIYAGMLTEPQDEIDPRVFDAAADLFERFTGDFTLGGEVRNVDLLGEAGTPLSGAAGYLNLGNT